MDELEQKQAVVCVRNLHARYTTKPSGRVRLYQWIDIVELRA